MKGLTSSSNHSGKIVLFESVDESDECLDEARVCRRGFGKCEHDRAREEAVAGGREEGKRGVGKLAESPKSDLVPRCSCCLPRQASDSD